MSLDGVSGLEDSMARDALLQGQIDKILIKADEVVSLMSPRGTISL